MDEDLFSMWLKQIINKFSMVEQYKEKKNQQNLQELEENGNN